MAAAAIGMAVPFVFPLVAKLMDKLFGDKTGAVKLDAGTKVLEPILAALQKLAGPSVGLPTTPTDIAAVLQSVVTDLNAKGELKGTATQIDTPPQATVSTEGVAMMLEGALKILRGT